MAKTKKLGDLVNQTVTLSAPLSGTANLTDTLNFSITKANTTTDGYVSATDWNIFNNKQDALGFTPYNATNPDGYISGITSGMVTTALGFTPYNSTNPSGYITGITSGMVTTALGYIPVNDALPKIYHVLRWFTPSSTVSSSGTTVTSIGTQFTSGMVNAKLTILGEARIITAFISSTQVTVASAYSTNYSGVASGSWGVYNIAYEITSAGFQYFYGYNSNNVGGYERVRIGSDLFCYENTSLSNYWQLTGVIKGLGLNNDGKVAWSSTNNVTQTKDLGLWRNSAGVLEINDGSTVATGLLANRRDLLVRNINASSLVISAGTTTIAPLKLTAGTNLTTPVNGSFEFDGTNLYFTVGGVRKTVTLI